MSKWKSNKILKMTLAIVSVLMAAVTICGVLAVITLGNMGVYTMSKEDVLKKRYDQYSDIYLAMMMGSRGNSDTTLDYVNQTNFRYGIIKADDISKVDIFDPKSYEYYNFEEMPKKGDIENKKVRIDEIVDDGYTQYNWDESLWGYGNIYRHTPPSEDYAVTSSEGIEKQKLITGYYYNVDDGIFYYATETEFYRVDQVFLQVEMDNRSYGLDFRYDSGQHAYYNGNPEEYPVKDYYLTFNWFDDTEASWQTWKEIYLDGELFERKSIRFVNDKNTASGEFQGKPIANRYYTFYKRGLIGTVGTETPVTDKAASEEIPKTGGAVKAETQKGTTYLVISKVRDPLQKTGIQLPGSIFPGDLYEQITVVMDYSYAWRYILIGVLAAALVLWGISTVLVLVMAGHRGSYQIQEMAADGGDTETGGSKGRWVDAVKPGLWQKIPLDIETCIIGFIGCMVILLGMEAFSVRLWNFGLPFALMASYIICFIWLTDFVIRLKLGKWWCGTFTYMCFAWIGRYAKKGVGFLRENISFLWRGILVLGGVSFLEFFGIVVTQYDVGAEFLIWLFYRGITVVLILLGMVQVEKLRLGAKNLAAGNLQEKVKTDKMFWEFKKHGEDLNSIGDGINLAVEKRMQSEHFRTELITNVSHDIKTPLTSIVNYVDLLQKEEIDNEKVKEYLEVLSRQSAKLKKLTEDLIEASKASTGSMPVHMEKLELGVFLTQTVGEFEEKLEAVGLRAVMRKPAREVFVEADGRHLWRVVENLVQNICKYAQPETRVYIDLEAEEREAVISFKNVSRYELNISGAELMERFVRGDSSRNTEGSGLGLSIAESLMELMHGKLEVVVDGDLFKVVLRFLR